MKLRRNWATSPSSSGSSKPNGRISGSNSAMLFLVSTRLIWIFSFLDLSVYPIYLLCSVLSAENDCLKAAAIEIADKVNCQGETTKAHLDVVDGRID